MTDNRTSSSSGGAVRDYFPGTISYFPASATNVMSKTPRFGKPDSFSSLFNEETRKPYLLGLLFGAMMTLVIFLSWTFIIIMFKMMGKARYGFLSGSPFEEHPKRPFYIRATFLLSGMLIIIFGCLFVTNGITNLRDTVIIINFNGNRIKGIVNEAQAIAASLRAIGQSSATVRDELIDTLGDFCPKQTSGSNSVDLSLFTGLNFDELAQKAIDLLGDLDYFLDGNIQSLESTLKQGTETIDEIQYVNNEADFSDWQVLLVFVPLVTLTSLLMIGAIMASFDMTSKRYTCLINYCFLPLFILMSIVSYCGAGAFMIAAALNADWCSGGTLSSPDGTMLDIMKVLGMNETSLGYQAVEWYVKQCDFLTNDPWLFVREYEHELKEANTTIADLSNSLQTITVEKLTQICGQDFGKFDGLLRTMRNNLRILFESAYAALRLLRCDRVVPIYTSLAYDGTCKYSVTGITWIWSSLIVIAFCSMVMIMFRSSMQKTSKLLDVQYLSENNPEINPFMGEDDEVEQRRKQLIHGDVDDDDDYGEDPDDFVDEGEDGYTHYDDAGLTRASSYRSAGSYSSYRRGGGGSSAVDYRSNTSGSHNQRGSFSMSRGGRGVGRTSVHTRSSAYSRGSLGSMYSNSRYS